MNFIKCQAELDIATVGALHQQLLDALQTSEPLEIDGQAVQKIHAAALQLFLSLMSEAQSQGLSVNWRNPSPAVVEGARLLGLSDRLGLETTATR
ncbi:MAG: STAS domain-containing protein [Candidatus Competibacteraceae bacterium]|nr:STAS domain-containing protein [Candidatus Competibacteraceae bacterium]MBK7985213.1 STAS domain-containing protein [Candidatus Competibacteraceae bacterium]MBK8895711.1 STAS domain-containing protein [Candidatus Competibacteraceae bacterium]MBK8962803.1 STAS domain-containing protein [Candidatus Competibacteraceae bacterium]MBK9953265.1 STAS domain-containing protein [Candidatus Competibacteraceae bacterium]